MKILFATNSARHAWKHRSTLALAALQSGHDVYFLCPMGKEVVHLQALGIKHIPLKIKRKGVNPLFELFTLLNILRVFKSIKPDIYHGFTIKLVIYGGICCRLLKVPKYLLNITGIGSLFLTDKHALAKKIVHHLYGWIFYSKNAIAIFQNSEDKKFFINHNWVAAQQTKIIKGTGIETSKIVPSYSTRNNKVNILYAGRIIKDKGLTELIKACENIQKQEDCLILTICGELDSGNPSCYSESEWKELINKKFIRFQGFQAHLKKYFENTDIACLASYREGMPLFLLEAGAYGKASITTDVPGCNTVIRHEENGLLVKAKDIESLQVALKLLIDNPDMRYRMGRKARQIVEKEFDTNLLIKEYLKLYKLD